MAANRPNTLPYSFSVGSNKVEHSQVTVPLEHVANAELNVPVRARAKMNMLRRGERLGVDGT